MSLRHTKIKPISSSRKYKLLFFDFLSPLQFFSKVRLTVMLLDLQKKFCLITGFPYRGMEIKSRHTKPYIIMMIIIHIYLSIYTVFVICYTFGKWKERKIK